MSFQRIVINVAIVILIIMLLFIGYAMYKAKTNATYPPEISQCPDYWKVVGENSCKNVMNLGNCDGIMDFSGKEWQGQSGMQKKAQWAKDCGIVWDGITYG